MQVSGRAYIDFPGIGRVGSQKGATLTIASKKRDVRVSDVGVEGYTEEEQPAKLTMQIQHRAGMSLLQFGDIVEQNISFATDVGSTWVVRGAWMADAPTLTDGLISLELMAMGCDEVKL